MSEDHAPKPSFPTSYKGAASAVQALDQVRRQTAAEIAQLRGVAKDLRRQIIRETRVAAEVTASECSLREEARLHRKEASELWALHQEPIREQETTLQRSNTAAEELERAAAHSEATIMKFQTECDELRSVGTTLCDTEEQLQSNYAGYIGHYERASERRRQLVVVWDENEHALEEAHLSSVAQLKRRNEFESEVSSAQGEVRLIQEELTEMERQTKRDAGNCWVTKVGPSEALAADIQVLRRELQQEESALDVHIQESAACRDQAFRSEAALLQTLGKDVAGGLRELKRRCDLHVSRHPMDGVIGNPEPCASTSLLRPHSTQLVASTRTPVADTVTIGARPLH